MTKKIIVQVRPIDSDDLAELDGSASIAEGRPFDGETMVQILYTLSPASLAALIAWIRARAASRKHYRIVVDGVEMKGYTAGEAERIVAELSRIADERRDTDESD